MLYSSSMMQRHGRRWAWLERPAFTALVLVALVLGAGPRAAVAQPSGVRVAFEEGNARYAEGAYDEAVLAYERALDAGYASAALYHNLGNAYVRLGQLGQAVRFYEKAQVLAPDDPRLRHNLETVRSRLTDPLVTAPPAPGLVATARRWPAGWGFALGVALVWAGVAALARHAWPPAAGEDGEAEGAEATRPADDEARGSSRLRPLGVAGLLAGLVLVALSWGASYAEALDRRTVVVASEATLRPAPDDTAAATAVLSEGSVLRLRQREAQWARVTLPDGTTGWLPATSVGDV